MSTLIDNFLCLDDTSAPDRYMSRVIPTDTHVLLAAQRINGRGLERLFLSPAAAYDSICRHMLMSPGYWRQGRKSFCTKKIPPSLDGIWVMTGTY